MSIEITIEKGIFGNYIESSNILLSSIDEIVEKNYNFKKGSKIMHELWNEINDKNIMDICNNEIYLNGFGKIEVYQNENEIKIEIDKLSGPLRLNEYKNNLKIYGEFLQKYISGKYISMKLNRKTYKR